MGKQLARSFPQDLDTRSLPYTVESSGLLTTDQSVVVGSGVLLAIISYTDGTNDTVVTLYDSASAASGTVLAKIKLTGADFMGGETQILVEFDNGIFVDITGTGSEVLVRYII